MYVESCLGFYPSLIDRHIIHCLMFEKEGLNPTSSTQTTVLMQWQFRSAEFSKSATLFIRKCSYCCISSWGACHWKFGSPDLNFCWKLFPVARWLLRLLSCNKSTTAPLSGSESAISRCEDAISRYCTPTPASKDLVKSAISKHDFWTSLSDFSRTQTIHAVFYMYK